MSEQTQSSDAGVTDPATGDFLPGGSTSVVNGQTLYGTTTANGGFYTDSGTTVVLPNGTAVSGSLNAGDGIFTGSNGSVYGITNDGIFQATPQWDGSFTLSNGQTVMTAQSWKVDLGEFSQAIATVSAEADVISYATTAIQGRYSGIESAWSSPAGNTFADVSTQATNAMNTLNTVLADMISRMRQSYQNYVQAETANVANVS